ncbi:MAG: ShlB/FhaC/HecB family hemolysin secretion/activation protein [Pikeienuella sp.]
MLQGVAFVGATAYDEARLRELIADKLGRPVDFGGLREITDRIEALYRADGFLAVRAVIPAQRIQSGVVQIRIIEAQIADVVVRGDLGRAEPEVRALLEPLIGQRPLSAAAAERALLLARDLPGVNLLAALRARQGETPGELVLLVEGTLAAVDGFASVSNLASEFSGPTAFTAGAAVNSAFLSGDRLEAVGLTSLDIGEQVLGQFSYDFPTGIAGLRGVVEGSITYSETGGPLSELDLTYRSQIVRVGGEYTIIRSRARTVTAEGGLEVIHQTSDALFDPIEIDEDLRVFYAGGRVIEADLAGGLLDARLGLRVGVEALGASSEGDPGLTRGPQTDPSFVSAQFNADYRRALPLGLVLTGRASGQASTGNLPSLETFSLGNYTIGRGFDPGSLTGDHGLAASLELAYPLAILEIAPIAAPEAFGFVDTGRVWNDGGVDAGLTSLGAGARWQVFDRVSAEVFVAVPVQSSDLVQDDDIRGLFRLTTFF